MKTETAQEALLRALLDSAFAKVRIERLNQAIIQVLSPYPHLRPPISHGEHAKLAFPVDGQYCEITFRFEHVTWARMAWPYLQDPNREYIRRMRDAVCEVCLTADNDLFTTPNAVIHVFEDCDRFEVSIFYTAVDRTPPAEVAPMSAPPISSAGRASFVVR